VILPCDRQVHAFYAELTGWRARHDVASHAEEISRLSFFATRST
jgi:hypothetical protein